MLKKGDTVWFINTCWTAESVGAQYISKGTVIATDGVRFILDPFKLFTVKDLGRYVFRTPSEAEYALRINSQK